ncbi:MAG: GTP cyclohydrolase I FolE [Phycisphaerae bacterium]|jgi:GTP cyclohydrolase I|nr:GTP cyclohydrolase I FolE [Phycisphaerae bacterium]HOO17290.1 GTP cyclohydrolase I FolE [Phycisphaerae bacterium]HPC21161.1 GTP cyclohydrolase I FolE [Phycisphaerae bacterium]HRT40748.1 GTP cyclohydrolase I FolE [Phycisphaerae bacterium]
MADIAPNRQPRGNTDPRRTAKRVGPSGDGRTAPAARKLIDIPTIERAFREILIAIGEDPDREGLRKTPARIARMYAELFAGLRQDAEEHLQATFDEGHHEMVVLRDIPFNSMCEHHFMPFEGKAHVAYIPGGKVLGLSKLARIVDVYSHRPQVQERLTSQVADLLAKRLQVKGCAVVLEAVHTCMTCRGVKKSGSVMITSALRGIMQTSQSTRAEALSLLNR